MRVIPDRFRLLKRVSTQSSFYMQAMQSVQNSVTSTPSKTPSHQGSTYECCYQTCMDKKLEGMKCKSHLFRWHYTSDSQFMLVAKRKLKLEWINRTWSHAIVNTRSYQISNNIFCSLLRMWLRSHNTMFNLDPCIRHFTYYLLSHEIFSIRIMYWAHIFMASNHIHSD
ncbi:hypothetical protein PVAP13_5KG311528 [Panicum virgatum]|uniref:Uncharacterized protein n=1 Tax=Panicum virgatum TaxID=38727 RepID=A0A8T0SHD3_PANVG|nr:hypothetical protein PVAP13_5KG311528 [Panicum virgatum]